jgi:hypothetical protein
VPSIFRLDSHTVENNAEATPVIPVPLHLLRLLRLVAVHVGGVGGEDPTAGDDGVVPALLAGGVGRAGVRNGGCEVGLVGCGVGVWDREDGTAGGGCGGDTAGEEADEGEEGGGEAHVDGCCGESDGLTIRILEELGYGSEVEDTSVPSLTNNGRDLTSQQKPQYGTVDIFTVSYFSKLSKVLFTIV